jgi:hypothetical protein
MTQKKGSKTYFSAILHGIDIKFTVLQLLFIIADVSCPTLIIVSDMTLDNPSQTRKKTPQEPPKIQNSNKALSKL